MQSEMLKTITGGLGSWGHCRGSTGSCGCLAPAENPPSTTAAWHGRAERRPSQLGYLALSVPELLAKASSVDGFLERQW